MASTRGGVRRTVRHRLKRAYFEALALGQVDRVVRTLRARQGVALILNFHRVSPAGNPYWPPMTPEAFATLVHYLSSRCRVLTLDELSNPEPAAAPRAVLSFDDGCRDFVEYAMPILERCKLRVNHNIIVRSVETGEPPWIIRVVDALGAATTTRVRALRLPGFQFQLDGDEDLAKTRYGTRLTGYLKGLPPAARESVCAEIDRLLGETDPAAWTQMMSLSDVQAMAAVHELGSHSYSHESMGVVSDSEFADDLDRCTEFFAGIRRPMSIFAFPNGSFRPGQIELVQRKGVKHVLLVGERPTRVGTGVYTRITMYGDSAAELRLRAMGRRV